jgi:HAD superfamily hydrolase (TIGR01509 family)
MSQPTPTAQRAPEPPSPIAAVLCDFHNTLVSADAWLELEIHTLPRVVLAALVADGRLPEAAGDHTLLAATDRAYAIVREQARASGYEVDAVTGVRRVLAELGVGAVGADALAAAVEAAERACLADTRLVPGVRAALTTLAADGRRLAVVSNAAYPPFVAWGLARYGLDQDFSIVAASGAAGYYKSDPRLYRWALDQLGVAPAAAVHVGDHWRWDVLGAQAAGLRAIWYHPPATLQPPLPGEPPPADFRPDAVITHMGDLPAAVARLERGTRTE